jgi:hypothetical protein
MTITIMAPIGNYSDISSFSKQIVIEEQLHALTIIKAFSRSAA